MKRIVILVCILLTAIAATQSRKPVYYDTFNEKWLDPAKWWPQSDNIGGLPVAETVREIQNGQLRLAFRIFGYPWSDTGEVVGNPGVVFTNPNGISSITTDVTLRSFSGTSCSTNPNGWTHTTVAIGGAFFNRGSGDGADDVTDIVALVVDTNNTKQIGVSNYLGGNGLAISTDMGSYPIGTTLIATLTWDKANHQFTSAVKVKDDPSKGRSVVVPYSVPDPLPPTWPGKALSAWVYSANCTSAQTFAQVEAFYDNVMVNQ